jgi:hypothetical protein
MQKELKDFTDIELKAIKCDAYETIQAQQESLNIINQELKRRSLSINQNKVMEPINDTVEETVTPEVLETTEVVIPEIIPA